MVIISDSFVAKRWTEAELRALAHRAVNSGNAELYPMLVMGGLVTIIPLIALFLVLQRYWRGGMLLGSIAN